MTAEQQRVIAELGHEGYAVIIWTPEELGEVNPSSIEERSIELGWQIIEDEK